MIDAINKEEQAYLDLLTNILREGTVQTNRTGVDSLMIPGAMLKFNVGKSFPAITTKKLAFGAVKGELLGFLRGYTSAAEFRALGCKIWDQNANENLSWLDNPERKGEDDLGYIYSRLWTDMPKEGSLIEGSEPIPWNQIDNLLNMIQTDPTSRRMIVSAWHPEVFYKAALPPCHVLFQVIIDQLNSVMHLGMYQRSCDMFLGVPFNIASYALLLEMLAKKTGYQTGTLTWFGFDCHIYRNHVDQVLEQISREPKPFPKLDLSVGRIQSTSFGYIHPDDISLIGYEHHPAILAPMAV